jgi:hypothetical protein
MKTRRMRWAGNVARIGKRKGVDRVLVEKDEEQRNLKGLGIGGRMILKWFLKKPFGDVCTGLIWFQIWIVAGFCLHGDEHSG